MTKLVLCLEAWERNVMYKVLVTKSEGKRCNVQNKLRRVLLELLYETGAVDKEAVGFGLHLVHCRSSVGSSPGRFVHCAYYHHCTVASLDCML